MRYGHDELLLSLLCLTDQIEITAAALKRSQPRMRLSTDFYIYQLPGNQAFDVVPGLA